MTKWNEPIGYSLTVSHAKGIRRKFGLSVDVLPDDQIKYLCPKRIEYYSKRYDKTIIVPLGYPSDGATGAIDLDTIGWWVHDVLCNTGKFSDGTSCTNWQASVVLHDILLSDGHWFFARRWFIATLLLGGGKARENGIFTLRS